MLLNEQDFSKPKLTVKKAKAHSSVAAIDIALRTVNNPLFTELCSQEHPGMRAVRNQERSALRLLQTHVRNRASHAPALLVGQCITLPMHAQPTAYCLTCKRFMGVSMAYLRFQRLVLDTLFTPALHA